MGNLNNALVKREPLVEEAADATWEIVESSQVGPDGMKVIRIPIPLNTQLNTLQQAYILGSLKDWNGYSLAFRFQVIKRCESLGLDPFRGEIYVVDGRLSTNDEAKIRYALESSNIEWYDVTDPEKAVNPITGKEDIFVLATAQDKRRTKPVNYKCWLSEWENPKNANWQKRPTDALQRKALARLFNKMVPLGADGEDFQETSAPSAKSAALEKGLTEALKRDSVEVAAEVIQTTEVAK